VARPTLLLEVANSTMIRYGVRALIVLNSNDQVAGLLTASDILGEKQMRFLQNMGGTHADIMVRDIMTPHFKEAPFLREAAFSIACQSGTASYQEVF